MNANGCSSSQWPTARAWDAESGQDLAQGSRAGAGGPTLTTKALNWPTASARDWKGSNQDEMHDRGTKGAPLNEVAVLWPKPSAKLGDDRRGFPSPAVAAERLASGRRNLDDAVSTWATPRASDAEKGGPNQAFGAGGIPLPAQAAQWATPTVKGDHNRVGLSDKSGDGLATQATSFTLDQVTSPDGGTSSPERRSLNPLFVEWLMGWPHGWTLGAWTDFACSETELSRYRQRMRSELLRLGSPAEAPPAQTSLFD